MNFSIFAGNFHQETLDSYSKLGAKVLETNQPRICLLRAIDKNDNIIFDEITALTDENIDFQKKISVTVETFNSCMDAARFELQYQLTNQCNDKISTDRKKIEVLYIDFKAPRTFSVTISN